MEGSFSKSYSRTSMIDFKIGNLNFKAMVEDDYGIATGATFEVGINTEKLHIFDIQ